MADQPRKRFTVQRIVSGHEGDLEAALNAIDGSASWELHNLSNGDVLLVVDAGEAPATASEPAQPVAS